MIKARDIAVSTILANDRPTEGSIEVVREKRLGDDTVVAMHFDDRWGLQRWVMLVFYALDDRWMPSGGFGGSARVTGDPEIWETWGFSGSATPSRRRAVAGGWVATPGAVSARITDRGGRVEEDAIESGVAILMWRGDLDPMRTTVEILDADGQVVKTGSLLRPR